MAAKLATIPICDSVVLLVKTLPSGTIHIILPIVCVGISKNVACAIDCVSSNQTIEH